MATTLRPPPAPASALDQHPPPHHLQPSPPAPHRPHDEKPPLPTSTEPAKRSWIQALREALDSSPEAVRAKAGEPNSWLSRYLAVGMVLAVVGWTVYVFVARVCVRMIQGRALTVGRGIGFLVAFALLLGMFGWSYLKILVTGPGFARDIVKAGLEGGQPDETLPTPAAPARPPLSPSPTQTPPPDPLLRASLESTATSSFPAPNSPPPANSPSASPLPSDPRPHDTLLLAPPPAHVGSHNAGGHRLCARPPATERAGSRTWAVGRTGGGDNEGPLERRPPRPEADFRWCQYCNLPKPPRTHHSTVEGTCVRRFDHFCPWIGQSVGQLNHKFFFVFCFWSTWFTLFVLVASAVSLAALDHDGMVISLLPLSAFFTLLTASLLGSHTWMLLVNLTTLEQVQVQEWQEAESAALASRFRFWQVGMKGEVRRRWAGEWGSVYEQGNRWWLGRRRNWEGTMGRSKPAWLLPLGRPLDDGPTFPVNPRVGPDGGWRPRSLWPEELR